MSSICGVYCIRNIITKKVYIGSSLNIKPRWSQHKLDLNKNKHYNSHLQRAWNKYGPKSFTFSIIEECQEKLLLDRENFWMEYYGSRNENTGYNLADAYRTVWSDESRQKASLSHAGSKNWIFGKGHSEKTRLQMSIDRKGISHHSKEWKKEHSEFMMGKQYGLGHKHSDEAKRKMSLASKNRPPISEETRKKISDNKKLWWANKKTSANNSINITTNLNSSDAIKGDRFIPPSS